MTEEKEKEGAGSENARSTPPARERRTIKSIKNRLIMTFLLYAVCVLAVLWIMCFIFFNSIYVTIIETGFRDVGRELAAIFPVALDDQSMQKYYVERVREIARHDEMTVAVFERDEEDNAVIVLTVDAMGNVSESATESLGIILEEIDFKEVFSKRDTVCVLSTSIGSYMFYGSEHTVGEAPDVKTVYSLSFKQYEIFNLRTMQVIYVLIIGTVVVLMLSVVFSLLAGRVQGGRLMDFSLKAKKLADGDFNVNFTGGGYEEYENLAGALNAAKDGLYKAENMQRDFIANVSHDIRTPLTMIKGYAEMLRDMPLSVEKRERTADVIISEADRLTALVGDMLDYSKLSSGVVEFKPETCDIAEMAKTVLSQFGIFTERDGVVFVTDIEENATAHCDKSRIQQVLYNLLNNAINFCGDDKTVILQVRKTENGVRVEVSDHGKGISEEELDAVWDRYYRSAHSKRMAVGSGLGLSICKNILTAHDAEFGVNSVIGEGSTFWFELAEQSAPKSS